MRWGLSNPSIAYRGSGADRPNSIPLPPEKQLPNIKVISVAALLANAVRRIHEDQSISDLFRDETPAERR